MPILVLLPPLEIEKWTCLCIDTFVPNLLKETYSVIVQPLDAQGQLQLHEH